MKSIFNSFHFLHFEQYHENYNYSMKLIFKGKSCYLILMGYNIVCNLIEKLFFYGVKNGLVSKYAKVVLCECEEYVVKIL